MRESPLSAARRVDASAATPVYRNQSGAHGLTAVANALDTPSRADSLADIQERVGELVKELRGAVDFGRSLADSLTGPIPAADNGKTGGVAAGYVYELTSLVDECLSLATSIKSEQYRIRRAISGDA